MRFKRQVAVILPHPAFHAASVGIRYGLHKHLPLAAQIICVRAIVPRQKIGRRVQHLARIGQQHAGQHNGKTATPCTEPHVVYSLQIGDRFGAGNFCGDKQSANGQHIRNSFPDLPRN